VKRDDFMLSPMDLAFLIKCEPETKSDMLYRFLQVVYVAFAETMYFVRPG